MESIMPRVLLLGGTAEAAVLARALAEAGAPAIYSYAGRTLAPAAQPLPVRIGGFGGHEGLAGFLLSERITHVIDATHPFAVEISANAVRACAVTGTSLIGFERAAWQPGRGDDWRPVGDIDAAVAALPAERARVFLAIGKQRLSPFAARPQHFYLLRLVDPPRASLPLADVEVVMARGPFTVAGDRDLLRSHRISHVVARNAGGAGARAKLDAARELGLPVILIERPALAERQLAHSVEEILLWLHHVAPLGVKT